VFSALPGGGVATIRRGDAIAYGLSWSPESGILFTTSAGLLRIDPTSRVVDTLLGRAVDKSEILWPHWAAGGRVATVTIVDPRSGTPRVALAHLDDRARLDTLTQGFNGQILSTGELLWSDASGTVYTAPLDTKLRRLRGGRRQLLAGVLTEPGLELRLSVSSHGDIVYALGSAVRARSRLVVVDRRTGERTALPSPPAVRVFPDLHLAPDGTRLAVSGIRGVSQEIWVYQLATSQVEAFTVDGISWEMTWSPDGRELTYCADAAHGIVTRLADKRGVAKRIAPSLVGCPRSWTPDGKVLLLDADSGVPRVLTLTPPDTVLRPLAGGSDGEFAPAVSPDGRWLAYAAAKSGTTDVWVRGYRDPGGPWQVSRGGGFDPVWSRDGRSLYFRTDSAIVLVDVPTGDTFRTGAAQRVTAAGSSVSAIYGQSFDVFPDGQRLVLFESGNGASVEQLILETNLVGRTRRP